MDRVKDLDVENQLAEENLTRESGGGKNTSWRGQRRPCAHGKCETDLRAGDRTKTDSGIGEKPGRER
jgi:hypothetical protein